jgi:hypothetical protein
MPSVHRARTAAEEDIAPSGLTLHDYARIAAAKASRSPRPAGDPYPDNGVALAAANAEIERGRATVAEQAVALHLHAGKARWD